MHWSYLILIVPLFLFSGAVHECAHAWAAYKLGDPTAKMMGRLTLDPRPHIDPIGLLMIILGFLSSFLIGWMKPVPVNTFNFRHPRRDFALVSLSGPGSNLLQAVVWYLLNRLVWVSGQVLPDEIVRLLTILSALGVILNISLLVFNIIPVPPLDGSRALAWLLPPRQAAVLDRIEPYGFFILLGLLWLGILQDIFVPLRDFALTWLFPGIMA